MYVFAVIGRTNGRTQLLHVFLFVMYEMVKHENEHNMHIAIVRNIDT